ncbi:MAG: Gfo/Idh/MocA family oxidoreductase, partial [Bacteroidota bacterium]
TPPYKHKEYTIKSLKAGKPVYVEKPMALNYSEAQEMVNVSKKTGVPLFVAYYRRWFPYFLKIKKILESETIGNVLSVNLSNILPARKEDFDLNKPPWHLIPKISGGGYFFDLACHQLDILDFLLGPIENVSGEYTNRAGYYWAEDTLTANLKFESSVLAACVWSYVGNKDNPIDRIEIYGTKGMITFSISSNIPIQIKVGKKEEVLRFKKPKHVEQPMIEKVVESLLGKNSYSSNMESASRTSMVMDKIMI